MHAENRDVLRSRDFMASRFEQAKAALRRVIYRTHHFIHSCLEDRAKGGAPSLIISFAVLHEITALVPFVATFYSSRALGLGDSLVRVLLDQDSDSFPEIRATVRSFMLDSQERMARVGSRYGVFGLVLSVSITVD